MTQQDFGEKWDSSTTRARNSSQKRLFLLLLFLPLLPQPLLQPGKRQQTTKKERNLQLLKNECDSTPLALFHWLEHIGHPPYSICACVFPNVTRCAAHVICGPNCVWEIVLGGGMYRSFVLFALPNGWLVLFQSMWLLFFLFFFFFGYQTHTIRGTTNKRSTGPTASR